MKPKAVYNDFNNEYIDKVALVGQAFMTDTADVHTYIVKLTSGNTVTEANMVDHASENHGRLESIALKDYFEGIVMHGVNTV